MFTLSFRGSCFLQIKLKSNHKHNQKRTQKSVGLFETLYGEGKLFGRFFKAL
jgi:hypothetical protein